MDPTSLAPVLANQRDRLKRRGHYKPAVSETAGIEYRFRLFHKENPSVYANLVILARKAKASGVQKYSIKGLYEVVRWELVISTNDALSAHKLNNNYTSRYARLIMSQEPDLRDFFETRELRTIGGTIL